MESHHLIDGASFGPEALKAIVQAYDEAWLVVVGNFNADTIETGRLRLADAILSVACEDSSDVEALKRGALEAMAISYHSTPSDRISN